MSFARSLAAAVAAANAINEVGAVVLHRAPRGSRVVYQHARLDDDRVPDMPRIVLPPLPEVPRSLSLAEIKANMTTEEAHRICNGIVREAGVHGKPLAKAVAFVQGSGMGNLRGVSKHSAHGGRTTDDTLVGSSMNVLNKLLMEKSEALEAETQECKEAEYSLKNEISQLGTEISEAQRDSSKLVGLILLGQSDSKTLQKNIEETEALLAMKRNTYAEYMKSLGEELANVRTDLQGMTSILASDTLNCSETAESIQTSLVQAGKHIHSAVECRECAHGVKVGVLKGEVHRQLSGMTSRAGKEALQGLLVESGSGRLLLQLGDGLLASNARALRTATGTECNESMGVDMKGKGYAGCQNKTIDGQACEDWGSNLGANAEESTLSGNYCRNPGNKSTIYCIVPVSEDHPGGFQFCTPVQHSRNFDGIPLTPDCAQEVGCVMTKGSCTSLAAQFEDVAGALENRRDELEKDRSMTEEDWAHETKILAHEIDLLEEDLGTTNAKLASDKGNLHTTQAKMTEDSMDYMETTADFKDRMNKCCALRTELQSEKCALNVVRDKLIDETTIEVFDCLFSDWQDAGEGGCFYPHGDAEYLKTYGTPRLHFCVPKEVSEDDHAAQLVKIQTREITQNVSYGTACPVMQKEERCENLPVCDVDCKQGDWSSWSDCSSECGGGTRTSTREVVVEAEGGGNPCGAGIWTQSCALNPCNQDCKLGDWQQEGRCSRSCTLWDGITGTAIGGFGHREQHRPIALEPVGTGAKCKEERDLCEEGKEETCRMKSRECNQDTRCELNATTQLIQCGGEFDLYFLIDSSGSLGRAGFVAEQNFVIQIMEALGDAVSTAVLDWSGPSWYYREYCRNANFEGKYPDVCGFNWVVPDPILDHTAAENVVEDMPFHWRYTYAHTALDKTAAKIAKVQAESERKRESVVVLLIDGIPTFTGKAIEAADRLKTVLGDGKLVVMALNYAAKNEAVKDMVTQMASEPKEDNFVTALSWADMVMPSTMNKLLLTVCPDTDGDVA